MIFMAIAIGSNIGCSVVISRFFGAKDFRKMKAAISTVLIASSVLAAVLTVVGLLTSGPLMRLIRTPEEIFEDGKLYLNIYIAGFLFLFLYNTATARISVAGRYQYAALFSDRLFHRKHRIGLVFCGDSSS